MITKDLVKKLEETKSKALLELQKLKNDRDALEKIRYEYLGRHGHIKEIFKEISALNSETFRKEIGALANKLKEELESKFHEIIGEKSRDTESEPFDETIPGFPKEIGGIHPITQFLDKIIAVFTSMGFEVVEDREVETQEVNFDLLNFPRNHPARDMQDTFYIKTKASVAELDSRESEFVLRTHTSTVQIRAMETRRPPVRLVVPGRVYRHEATDASHETTFYQLEGLVIDKGISVPNMIHVLSEVIKALFGNKVKIRLRPSFFPFVEPGHEVDMSCIMCEQKGCSVCKKTGWVEMLGSGMVHPNVLKNMKVDPGEYSGFAFGMGIDRLVMLYYGIHDIRLSYSGDLRFLKQL